MTTEMGRVFSHMAQRPAAALIFSMQMLNERLPVSYIIDAVVSRFIFAVIGPLGSEGFETTAQREEHEGTRSIAAETAAPWR